MPRRVVFWGPFKAGKSTLINALLGTPDLAPAEDEECTFAVCAFRAPSGTERDELRVRYWTFEEAVRHLLESDVFRALGRWNEQAHRDAIATFRAEEAIAFVVQSAERAMSGEREEEAGFVLDGVAALRAHRERLGSTRTDAVSSLRSYVRKGDRPGHAMLVRSVDVLVNAALLREHDLVLVDTPGYDSINGAGAVAGRDEFATADLPVIVYESRGLGGNFVYLKERIEALAAPLRRRLLLVNTKVDWIEAKALRRPEAGKAPFEILFENLLFTLGPLGIGSDQLAFVVPRLAELELRSVLTEDEARVRPLLRRACDDKLAALSEALDPRVRRLLEAAFRDGGVRSLQERLLSRL